MHVDKAITWVKDKSLDDLYESLRAEHVNTNHRLNKNYSRDHVQEVSAKSIYWGADGNPKIVASILTRPCWPGNVYRILNRLWKTEMNTGSVFEIDPGFGKLIESQTDWCLENGAHGVFMSRQNNTSWQAWAQPIFIKQTGIEFISPSNRFLTCDNELDNTCWQQILYYGDTDLLNTWKKR